MPELKPLFTHPPLTKVDAYDLAAAVFALADPARLQLLSLLAVWPGGEATGMDLTSALGRLHQTTVGYHLDTLEEAGLIVRRTEGRTVLSRLAPAAITAVLDALRPDGGDR